MDDNGFVSVSRTTSAAGQDAVRVCASLIAAAYCVCLLVWLSPQWPAFIREPAQQASGFVHGLIARATPKLDGTRGGGEIRQGVYFLLMAGIVPWIVMTLIGRGRPRHVGIRMPNRIGLRVFVAGFLISFPFLVYVASGEQFSRHYTEQIARAGAGPFLIFGIGNLLGEHFFFHGALLAVGRRGLRWPEPPPVVQDAETGGRRFLQWLGLAQPTEGAGGLKRVTRWIGLPDGCVMAVLVSAILFALVHLGKDPRELLISGPSGVGLAYVAYRTNGWIVPFLLHGVAAAASVLVLPLLH